MSSPVSATTPPTALPFQPHMIPPPLAERAQWVTWRFDPRLDKPDEWMKTPLNPHNHGKASSTNPATWATLPESIVAVNQRGATGVGFVFSPDDPYTGIDIDHCRDPQTGEIASWAKPIIDEMASYTELSPSGTGVHIIVEGSLPREVKARRRQGPVEMYDAGRYFTVTGHPVPGAPTKIESRQAQLDALYARTFAPAGTPSPTPPTAHMPTLWTDDKVIERAQNASNGAKFERLFRGGDTSDYDGDDSAADLALCGMLSFWTQDSAQVDRLFRRSGLYREKWDRADYRDRTIAKALERSEVYTPPSSAQPRIITPSSRVASTAHWPALPDDAAFAGLAGDVVRALEPGTEADPVALLTNYLVMFSSAAGRGPHTTVGYARHGINLNVVQVGQSAKARKGTAAAGPRRIMADADPTWASTRILSGLSSGEGLIWAVRDPIEKIEPLKEGKQVTGYQSIVIDQGVEDKRLLVMEEEFASVLKVANREGSTLSPVLRQAWDGQDLRTMTKNSPAVATAPHVSIMGHITQDELLRYLDSTEAANGFGNRFLWLCVRRSKTLPEGSVLPEEELRTLANRTHAALAFAHRCGAVQRDEEARALWAEVYPDLSEGRPGLCGVVTARAEAQVLRLSLLFALLDESRAIRSQHLTAALAFWDYADASARFIFGDATGDPIADRVLRELRTTGAMTQTDIVNLFHRHANAARIGAALDTLVQAHLIDGIEQLTGGRAARVWTAR